MESRIAHAFKLLLLLLCVECHDIARAADITFGAESDFNSRYVWLGMASSRGPVWQPSIWVADGDTTLTFWTNFVVDNEPQRGEFTTIDLTLATSAKWKGWQFEPSIEYWNDRQIRGIRDPQTAQASVKVSHPVGALRAFTDETFDCVAFRGAYYGDAGLSFDKGKKFAFSSAARLGWANSDFNKAYAGVAITSPTYTELDVSLAFHPRSHLYIKPHFEASQIVNRNLRAVLKPSDIFNAGLAIGCEF